MIVPGALKTASRRLLDARFDISEILVCVAVATSRHLGTVLQAIFAWSRKMISRRPAGRCQDAGVTSPRVSMGVAIAS